MESSATMSNRTDAHPGFILSMPSGLRLLDAQRSELAFQFAALKKAARPTEF
jgi:hypothetical protein